MVSNIGASPLNFEIPNLPLPFSDYPKAKKYIKNYLYAYFDFRFKNLYCFAFSATLASFITPFINL